MSRASLARTFAGSKGGMSDEKWRSFMGGLLTWFLSLGDEYHWGRVFLQQLLIWTAVGAVCAYPSYQMAAAERRPHSELPMLLGVATLILAMAILQSTPYLWRARQHVPYLRGVQLAYGLRMVYSVLGVLISPGIFFLELLPFIVASLIFSPLIFVMHGMGITLDQTSRDLNTYAMTVAHGISVNLLLTCMVLFFTAIGGIRRAHKPGHCVKCSYNLAGLGESLRCPECGTVQPTDKG